MTWRNLYLRYYDYKTKGCVVKIISQDSREFLLTALSFLYDCVGSTVLYQFAQMFPAQSSNIYTYAFFLYLCPSLLCLNHLGNGWRPSLLVSNLPHYFNSGWWQMYPSAYVYICFTIPLFPRSSTISAVCWNYTFFIHSWLMIEEKWY